MPSPHRLSDCDSTSSATPLNSTFVAGPSSNGLKVDELTSTGLWSEKPVPEAASNVKMKTSPASMLLFELAFPLETLKKTLDDCPAGKRGGETVITGVI